MTIEDNKKEKDLFEDLRKYLIEKELHFNIEDLGAKPMWGVSGYSFTLVPSAVSLLPPGIYEPMEDYYGKIHLTSFSPKTDELVVLPDEPSDKIFSHIQEFWKMRSKFEKFGFTYKRGVLLYGPAGGGKTTALFRISNLVMESGGVSLLMGSPYTAWKAIRDIRAAHEKMPIVVILEDLDFIIAHYGDKVLTSILDGEKSVDNVLFLATTNFPERLPKKIINRPSRFDILEFIGLPTAAARKVYLESKTNLSPSKISVWVEKTDGFSIPALKELIIKVLIFGAELDEAIEKIRNFPKVISSSDFEFQMAEDMMPVEETDEEKE